MGGLGLAAGGGAIGVPAAVATGGAAVVFAGAGFGAYKVGKAIFEGDPKRRNIQVTSVKRLDQCTCVHGCNREAYQLEVDFNNHEEHWAFTAPDMLFIHRSDKEEHDFLVQIMKVLQWPTYESLGRLKGRRFSAYTQARSERNGMRIEYRNVKAVQLRL
jgi:hypothetical protein